VKVFSSTILSLFSFSIKLHLRNYNKKLEKQFLLLIYFEKMLVGNSSLTPVKPFPRRAHAFRETGAAINGPVGFRLERYFGFSPAFIAFNLKHSFLSRVKSPLFA
jgi:hypothetical protein